MRDTPWDLLQMSARRSGLVLGAGDLEAGTLGDRETGRPGDRETGRPGDLEQRAESQRSEVSEQSTSHPCSFIPIRLGIRVPKTIPAEEDQAHRESPERQKTEIRVSGLRFAPIRLHSGFHSR
jgi:hypothetical protein